MTVVTAIAFKHVPSAYRKVKLPNMGKYIPLLLISPRFLSQKLQKRWFHSEIVKIGFQYFGSRCDNDPSSKWNISHRISWLPWVQGKSKGLSNLFIKCCLWNWSRFVPAPKTLSLSVGTISVRCWRCCRFSFGYQSCNNFWCIWLQHYYSHQLLQNDLSTFNSLHIRQNWDDDSKDWFKTV